MCAQDGVSDQGVSAKWGSVCSQEGVYPSLNWAGDVCPSACGDTPPSPPVNRMTDAWENITLPQLRCGR